jgi:hypothetical protein
MFAKNDIRRKNGVAYDINGMPLNSGKTPEAHIPLDFFDINRMP